MLDDLDAPANQRFDDPVAYELEHARIYEMLTRGPER